jgi:hypothetical protein
MTHPLDALFTASTQPTITFKTRKAKYNGYTCHFLLEPIIMKLFSSAMSVTCNDSVAVFSMPGLLRKRLALRMDQVLEAGIRHAGCVGTVEVRNPFKCSPAFLRIAPDSHAQVFTQADITAPAESAPRDDLKRGMYFKGRLAVEVIGIKFSKDGASVSPMLRVIQVFKMAAPKMNTDAVELNNCVLDEPITDEDDSEDDESA